MEKAKVQALEQRLIQFGVSLLKVTELLPDHKAAKHIEGQLVRSGTAPALIYAEAQSAESKADFLHKMKMGLKELRETFVGLKFIDQMAWVAQADLAPLLKENDELISIFVASIKTASGK
ncbi:four helix bundle protein [Flaviaesturariibacter amylovorans]|uniref:Four helix bundle protein n=2 Tax=Flaviaesturariibacter amylovorans TaxID=1084520 RepID=A0ABP8HU41_9BACT